jgi:hypothetical protein
VSNNLLSGKALESPFVTVILPRLSPIIFEVSELVQHQVTQENDRVLSHFPRFTPVSAEIETAKNARQVVFTQFGPDDHGTRQLTAHRKGSGDWVPHDGDVVGYSPLCNVWNDLKRHCLRCMTQKLRFENFAVILDLEFHAA